MSDYLSADTPFETIGFRKICKVNGRTLNDSEAHKSGPSKSGLISLTFRPRMHHSSCLSLIEVGGKESPTIALYLWPRRALYTRKKEAQSA